jgi:Family of unknown function (DUF5694)
VRILLVGSNHFGNPGRDVINAEMDDVLGAGRQAEIVDLTGRLAGFAPTVVAVERPADRQREVDADYAAYRAGSQPLGRDEAQQIGFRLAASLGHDRVLAVDWNDDLGAADPLAYAREHEPDLYAAFEDVAAEVVAADNAHLGRPLPELFAHLNSPDALRRNERLYALTATMGVSDGYRGAAWVAGWVGRNLRILANLLRATRPADRVLLLYGAGHVPELARAITAYDPAALEDVLPYLS